MTTLEGLIVDWNLFAANADEREGALAVLENSRNLSVRGDNSVLSLRGDNSVLDPWPQAILHEEQGLLLLTPKRKNQQNTPAWDALMNRMRRLIETTFAQAKGTFGLEKPRARSVWGILSRVIAKITGLTIRAHNNRRQGQWPLRLAEFSF